MSTGHIFYSHIAGLAGMESTDHNIDRDQSIGACASDVLLGTKRQDLRRGRSISWILFIAKF